jgi:hypothetical protein
MGQALRIEEPCSTLLVTRMTGWSEAAMMRWDKAKHKYVQTTVGSELSGDSNQEDQIRGQLVISDKMKLGQLYVKAKKTNRSVGRVGA